MQNQGLDFERIIHSVKTALACLLGFVIAKYLHFGIDQWLIITVIVVMCSQVNVGSVLQKSLMRFLGTLGGLVFAVLALWWFGSSQFSVSAAIILSVLFFSYIATSQKFYNDAGTLGAATTVIVLMNHNPTILMAGERFLEINIGILLAALISQFVLPIHARNHLRRSQIVALKQLSNYYVKVLVPDLEIDDIESINELDEKIAQLLAEQRKLAKQARHELLGKAYNPEIFKKMFVGEKEILRSINFIHRALMQLPDKGALLQAHPLWQDFNKQLVMSIGNVANRLDGKTAKEVVLPIAQLAQLKVYIDEQVRQCAAGDVMHLYAVLFGAEILLVELENIMILTKKVWS
jgi:uncharacterized membrane protein YgaE (UPF0421/DUF939 family)